MKLLTYEQREALASMEQGTTSIMLALTREGIPCTIEQTGGFNMLVKVSGNSGAWVGINDGTVCYYLDEEDEGKLIEYRSETESNTHWKNRAVQAVKELLEKLGEIEVKPCLH